MKTLGYYEDKFQLPIKNWKIKAWQKERHLRRNCILIYDISENKDKDNDGLVMI